MALRQYQPEQDYESFPKENQATYQEYRSNSIRNGRIKEVLFFLNIALFGVLTVIAAYIYLSLKVPTFLAFPLAMATGLMGQGLIRARLKRHFKKKQTGKKTLS